MPAKRSGALRRCGLLVLLASLALSGCYRSRLELINFGEQAPVAGGDFACVSSERNEEFAASLTEKTSRHGRRQSYSYVDVDGRSYKLARLASGLWLVQTGNEGGIFEYALAEFDDRGGFRVFADTEPEPSLAAARLRQLAVHARPDGVVVNLRGRPDALRSFFATLDRSWLRETSRCRPG